MELNPVNVESMVENQNFNINSFRKPLVVDCTGYDESHKIKSFHGLDHLVMGIEVNQITSKCLAKIRKFSFNMHRHHFVCHNKRVPFSQIDEIRIGQKTNRFNNFQTKCLPEHSRDYADVKSFSVIYIGQRHTVKSLDFICETEAERKVLVSALYYTVTNAKATDNEMGFVKSEFDKFGKESLNLNETKKLLEMLNYSTNSEFLNQMISMVDRNDDQNLDFIEFSDLLHYLRARPELKLLMERYSQPDQPTTITVQKLIEFFRNEQHEEWSEAQVHELTSKYNAADPNSISFDHFENYLTSDENLAVHPKVRQMYQDTNHPISHYWINSSHNTYLSGHQLKGHSSSEMYLQTLKSGCRCVELDVWDAPDGEPMIFHGNTLTSQIKFSHVLETIKSSAFATSPYPVILSLEVHCSEEQQKVMAHHLVTILGEMLPPVLDDNAKVFPTLEQLKYKFLLKFKRISSNPHDQDVTDESDEYDEENPPSFEETDAHPEEEHKKHSIRGVLRSGFSKIKSLKDRHKDKDSAKEAAKKKEKGKIAVELSNLIYLSSSNFTSTDETIARSPAYMHSFSESKVKEFYSGNFDTCSGIHMSQTHMIRVYPRGTRFGSSNYDPLPSWVAGFQLVALNHQTSAEPMWLNEGMFEDNGCSGYVLKPTSLLPSWSSDHGYPYDPSVAMRYPGSKFTSVIIEILSARQLPKYSKTTKGEVIDPFVTISIHGQPGDQADYKTKVIDNNGFNPYWGETCNFPLYNSQVGLLLIRVDDKDSLGRHNRIGHYATRLENLRQGYRVIRLRNDLGNVIPLCTLLVKITLIDEENTYRSTPLVQ
ncbi:hypothetical protein SAMD00019534_042310 [Acytostelium subglobosum LB1]|uniref:hypothetical protein n=1 Tax=Acytostelium subglobosum LB1 TaxID=1410327 RepID=UPI000644C327|nr:hypothetical protein SAMD00019534_042310 [Acytostelium subglobosum LB1]GAM21056.1 hypothetical protein SAMD00019534_042310 [Acytostelium subglobosum LB1]|eukprot:XP_012756190.1 hypothetical protein SAMD00019534_042310 [Acytostelium subglobosum LB1]